MQIKSKGLVSVSNQNSVMQFNSKPQFTYIGGQPDFPNKFTGFIREFFQAKGGESQFISFFEEQKYHHLRII